MKHPKEAKELEMKGWDYSRHLQGRLFSVIVQGDPEGAESVRRQVSDWLKSMDLQPAGALAEFDRYIGYWELTPPVVLLTRRTNRFRRRSGTPREK